MSYRRFLALFSGLSGESVFFARIRQRDEEKAQEPIAGAENIAASIASKMATKRKR